MLKSSLIEILRTFSADDISEFEDFVNSPFHNKKSNAVKLFHAVKKFAPGFNDERLAKEEIWKKVFPSKSYNYGIMKNLIHDLTKLAESFIAHLNFNSGLGYDRHLIRELYNRNLDSAFLGKLEKFRAKNKPQNSDSTEYFQNMVYADRSYFEYSTNRIAFEENKNETFKNLFNYFLNYILLFDHAVYVEEHRVNIKYDFPFIRLVLDYLDKHPEVVGDSDVVKIRYYTSLCERSEGNELNLEKLVATYSAAKDSLSRADRYSLSIGIVSAYENMFLNNIFKYEKDFILHLVEMIESNVYSDKENDYVNLYSFSNVMSVCNRNMDSRTMKSFLENNIHRIQPSKRESMKNYVLCVIAFIDKNYADVIYHAAKVNHNDFFDSVSFNCYFKISSKVRIVFSYYELSNYEAVLTEIDSALHFIKNNKYLPATKKGMERFFKVLRRITLLNDSAGEFEKNQIAKEINKYKGLELLFRNWLLSKLNKKIIQGK